ncbi:aminodeoxychorismate/anthranilate synthase component II [Pacificimonas flava]|uniref:Aminodeoxychorismate/anthranilate synthase component II n=2 Tax=Pacificimonas TaxID=1960290 RepID=A0A219B6W5_9SPHN|nr:MULTISPECIES: aminodeoxychorismate/anthranilate synthase component II [Pacificimonas]MBZ6378617.1 aminodeoxychorismate/anthranilate synthase component II [Pacificimonas aurantium]OWV34107.1 aminodeoxychorismate/anthranilate synthase component II [Pacificimonas flava]
MILVIDNYDSFTYNLVHYLQELGETVETIRNDRIDPAGALALKPEAIVISPGPCSPNEAGVTLPLVAAAHDARVPLLGVCLGHQAIAQHFGGKVVRAEQVMHGKTCPVLHDGTGVFAGLPSPFTATRYHSLIAVNLASPLIENAWSEDGVVQGIRHESGLLHGVQFHPESIATEHGHALLANFLKLARA